MTQSESPLNNITLAIVLSIILVLVLILGLSTVSATSGTTDQGIVQIGIGLETDSDIDSNINLNANGSITNTLYCNGIVCTTNVAGGTVVVPENQTFTYHEHTYEYVGVRKTGLSLRGLLSDLSRVVDSYARGETPRFPTPAWDFFRILDHVFVSHREFNPTFHNMLYLADEVDRLSAENEYLRIQLGVEAPSEVIECMAGLNKAKRTNSIVRTKSGFTIDLESYGEVCVRVEER